MQPPNPDLAAGVLTKYLRAWRGGDEGALEQLTSQVYSELRRLAASVMSKHAANPTLQPTSLVHELYLQLPDVQEIDWQSRTHFLNVAAKMMRNILVDHARKRGALKRGVVVPLETDVGGADSTLEVDVLRVDLALDQLAAIYPRHARVVELRFFGGLTVQETVDVLKVTGADSSVRTVERDWTFARAWLKNAIEPN